MDTKRKNKGGRNYKKKYATDEERAAAQRARRAAQPVGPTGRLVPSVPRVDQDPQVNPPPGSPETAVVPDNTERLLELIDRLLGEPQTEAVRKNLGVRRLLLEAMQKKPGLWRRVRGICKRRVELYVNWFVWQYNPMKMGGEVGPFVLWDFQEEALGEMTAAYEEGRSCVIEKSREMGLSWLMLILCDHRCRFYDWQKWLLVSRSADAVDAPADPDSLMWKMDFVQEHLPAALQGERRALKERKRFHIHYPLTRSTVTGQASTGRAGVGGRAHAAVIDEFSMILEDREVRQRTASTARCRFFNGTHNGTGTEFFNITSRTPEIKKIVVHWHRHPDKNQGMYSYDMEHRKLRFWEYVPGSGLHEIAGPKTSFPAEFAFVMDGSPTGGPHPGLRSPWYDAQCIAIGTARGVAQELDIDPKGSAATPFEPLLIHQLKQACKPPLWEGDAEVDAQGQLEKLVEMRGGPLKLWVPLRNGEPPRGLHAAGADVSAGVGATPSCLSIGNMRTGQKVLRYANAHIQPDKFGLLAAALCRLFADGDGVGAKIAWENLGGPGIAFGNALTNTAGHRHIYEMGEEDNRLKRGKKIRGFRTTGEAKNALIVLYILALRNLDYVCYDEEALDDCLNFLYDAAGRIMHAHDVGSDPESARENHGDLVIADALCAKLIVQAGRLTARKKPEMPTVAAEDNILTVAGRQAARRRQQVGGW